MVKRTIKILRFVFLHPRTRGGGFSSPRKLLTRLFGNDIINTAHKITHLITFSNDFCALNT